MKRPENETPSHASELRKAEQRAIEERAAEWFGRCELGLNAAQERELLAWLQADPRHGEAMREMDATWDLLDRLKESPRFAAEAARATSSASGAASVSERARPVSGRRLWFVPVTLAAAAALALTWFLVPQGAKPALPQTWQAQAEAGGMKKLELPDGSTVHVNAESAVEVVFSREARRVVLQRGEAHFTVAKDPARPFVVVAGDVAVKAIGTAFNVRRKAEGVDVFVTEGKVRLDEAAGGRSLLPVAAGGADAAGAAAQPSAVMSQSAAVSAELLVAGQHASVSMAEKSAATDTAPAPTDAKPVVRVTAMPLAEMQQATAWQVRQLDFDQKPLAEVVADFNRYNSHQLVIADAELARRPFGGSFRADNVEGFVQLLEERFGVVAKRGEGSTTLRAGER